MEGILREARLLDPATSSKLGASSKAPQTTPSNTFKRKAFGPNATHYPSTT